MSRYFGEYIHMGLGELLRAQVESFSGRRIGAAVALDVLCCYFPGRKELIEADEVKVTRNRTRARNISQDLASSARAQVR